METSQRTTWFDRALPTFKAWLIACFPKPKPPTRFQVWFGRATQIIVVGLILTFAVWRLHLHFEIRSLVADYRAAGLPTDGEELDAFYPAVPAEQNAALGVMEAAGFLQEYPDERRFEVRGFRVPWRTESLTPEEADLLRGYVSINSNALARLSTALTLPESRYPVDLSEGFYADLDHVDQVKELGELLEYRTLLASTDGEVDVAVNSIQDLVGLAGTLNKEPKLLSFLVRSALLRKACRSTERLLGAARFEPPHLTLLEECFDSLRETNIFARALVGEVASVAEYLRLRQHPMVETIIEEEEGVESPESTKLGLGAIRLSGLFARDLRFYLAGMQTNLMLARLPPPECLVITNLLQQMEKQGQERRHHLGVMLLASSKVVPQVGVDFARKRLVLTGLAIEQFRFAQGRLPDGLEELVPDPMDSVPIDPFDGQPLRYRTRENGYVVYSIGRDGRDDGGRELPPRTKSSNTNSYDLTFIVER